MTARAITEHDVRLSLRRIRYHEMHHPGGRTDDAARTEFVAHPEIWLFNLYLLRGMPRDEAWMFARRRIELS